jgi:hypothetical protein
MIQRLARRTEDRFITTLQALKGFSDAVGSTYQS